MMARKRKRKGISLVEAVRQFSDEAAAEAWFVHCRWPDGIRCPWCEGDNVTPRKSSRKTPAYRCNPCRRDFTVKTGTLMHDCKLPLSKWAMAFYLLSSNPKGVSSMQLHRDLGITQKCAWHMAHRIRQAWDPWPLRFRGPVEADETYIGGKEGNKHESHRLKQGRGAVRKTPVAGVRDRRTGRVSAAVLQHTISHSMMRFLMRRVRLGATIYTDDHHSWRGFPNHYTVKHSSGEYVRGPAHTNSLESFWATMKRAYVGTYHYMSKKHLPRYVQEFEGRHNLREEDTADQMTLMARSAVGKQLPWRELVKEKS